MLKTEEVIEKILPLFANSKDTPFTVGNGIITTMQIGFDKEKLEASKKDIAKMLEELGVVDHPLIDLYSLTTTKDDEVWNEVKTFEDFQALELLLACSDACGFIVNNSYVKRLNINQIGDVNSIIISRSGRKLLGDEEWLKCIRETILKKMYFLTNPELLNKALNKEEKTGEDGIHK